jgi:hypothetical protein
MYWATMSKWFQPGRTCTSGVPPVPVEVMRVAVRLVEPLPGLAPTRENPSRAVHQGRTDLDVVPRGNLGVEVELRVDGGADRRLRVEDAADHYRAQNARRADAARQPVRGEHLGAEVRPAEWPDRLMRFGSPP